MDEHVLCSFKRSTYSGQWICTEPEPKGSHVIVWEMKAPDGNGFWPTIGQHYIVRIDRLAKSGKSRIGTIVLSLKVLEKQLVEALKSATWERDRHNNRQVVGEYLEIPGFKFKPVFDSGGRGTFECMPIIWFRAHPATKFADLLEHRLACADDSEIERAKKTPLRLPTIV